MNIDDFLELVHTRRSVRKFAPDAVPPDILGKILEAGRWAMSGANAQPWEFVVVQDGATRAKIVDSWLAPNQEAYVMEQTRVPEIRHHQLREPLTTPHFKDAPVFIVMVGDRRTYQATVLGASFLVTEGAADAIYLKNMANATQDCCTWRQRRQDWARNGSALTVPGGRRSRRYWISPRYSRFRRWRPSATRSTSPNPLTAGNWPTSCTTINMTAASTAPVKTSINTWCPCAGTPNRPTSKDFPPDNAAYTD